MCSVKILQFVSFCLLSLITRFKNSIINFLFLEVISSINLGFDFRMDGKNSSVDPPTIPMGTQKSKCMKIETLFIMSIIICLVEG